MYGRGGNGAIQAMPVTVPRLGSSLARDAPAWPPKGMGFLQEGGKWAVGDRDCAEQLVQGLPVVADVSKQQDVLDASPSCPRVPGKLPVSPRL